MTRDEARKILGEEATEEQITNLLNNYHVQESNKVKELETQLNGLKEESNKYSDYDEIKAKLDEINKASMSEQEKLANEKKEAEEYLSKSKIIYNTAKAKEILAGLELSDDLISLVVSDDETATINNANKLKEKFDSTKEVVAKETKESLMNADLKPTITNVNQNEENETMTFEKFSKMSASEQEKWISENPEEFENL